MSIIRDTNEWLEPDGLGGFASGTVTGIRTRRYHALLLTATTPPTGRIALVNGFDAWVDTPRGRFALTSQRYPGAVHPDGAGRIAAFALEPWPRWTYRLEDGIEIEHEICVPRGASAVTLSWRLRARSTGVSLTVRPFLSGRDYHSMHHENPAFRFDPEIGDGRTIWRPYDGVPGVIALANGEYRHEPDWYRNFVYEQERERGLDSAEDLASPGTFQWDLSSSDAIWILGAEGFEEGLLATGARAADCAANVWRSEAERRRRFPSSLHRAADAYLVVRGRGRTLLAGYPWFTDWGRDTFIAVRGLCVATGRLADARDILLAWAETVSQGMLPNRFPDAGAEPEFNSVDASLWYVVAVNELLRLAESKPRLLTGRDRTRLEEAVGAILAGYSIGTRYGIRQDADGLLAAGEPGQQLTWMDARVDGREITPRIGKPVEIQALWLNALWAGAQFDDRWRGPFERGRLAFADRFWHEPGGYLSDVVDVDHRPGTVDATFRPNQILAVGGLPQSLLDGARARRVVDAVEARLWTPLGLRSLAPEEPGYVPRYEGGVAARDGAYHQGTVWPWLVGPFVEAWIRVRCGSTSVRQEARARFVAPLLEHLEAGGLGHVSEIADADAPHTPRGCPFQAWSLGELIRTFEATAGASGPTGARTRQSNQDVRK